MCCGKAFVVHSRRIRFVVARDGSGDGSLAVLRCNGEMIIGIHSIRTTIYSFHGAPWNRWNAGVPSFFQFAPQPSPTFPDKLPTVRAMAIYSRPRAYCRGGDIFIEPFVYCCTILHSFGDRFGSLIISFTREFCLYSLPISSILCVCYVWQTSGSYRLLNH